MIKKIIFSLAFILSLVIAKAQMPNPVKWNVTTKKIKTNEFEITATATVTGKWHIYSSSNPKGGAEPTSIKYKNGTSMGTIKEIGKVKTIFEQAFGVKQKFFEGNAKLVQIVKVKPNIKKLNLTITYMVCNDSQCLPPKDLDMEIVLK